MSHSKSYSKRDIKSWIEEVSRYPGVTASQRSDDPPRHPDAVTILRTVAGGREEEVRGALYLGDGGKADYFVLATKPSPKASPETAAGTVKIKYTEVIAARFRGQLWTKS